MLLQRYLEESARATPSAEALVCGQRRFSYADLDARANRLARGLVSLGVRPGDRVAIHLDNDIDAVAALFAALKAGATFMMVNPSTKEPKLRYLLRDAEARAVILPAGKLPRLAGDEPSELVAAITVGDGDEQRPVGISVRSMEDVLGSHRDVVCPWVPRTDRDLAALLYTSGSTGEPKGVMLTHRNVVTAIDAVAQYLSLRREDVLLNVLPLSFGYGLTQLFSAFKVGARLVLERGMVYPHATLAKAAAEGATGFAMVPTIASLLLRMDLGPYDLSRLRYVTNAGAALPTDHVRRLRAALPRAELFLMYGQTECLRISYLESDQVDARPDSVGRGMPNQELSLVDEAGGAVAPGCVGELVVHGEHVMAGYWKRPDDTARKLRPGRHGGSLLFTGDLFRRDDQGYLYFVRRQDDVIKSKGEKVSPREVEDALYGLPEVAEVAVVGVADPVVGEVIKAVLVLCEGASLSVRDVQRHCAERLEDFMVPSLVEFRAALPKTSTGKILKQGLGVPARTGSDRT